MGQSEARSDTFFQSLPRPKAELVEQQAACHHCQEEARHDGENGDTVEVTEDLETHVLEIGEDQRILVDDINRKRRSRQEIDDAGGEVAFLKPEEEGNGCQKSEGGLIDHGLNPRRFHRSGGGRVFAEEEKTAVEQGANEESAETDETGQAGEGGTVEAHVAGEEIERHEPDDAIAIAKIRGVAHPAQQECRREEGKKQTLHRWTVGTRNEGVEHGRENEQQQITLNEPKSAAGIEAFQEIARLERLAADGQHNACQEVEEEDGEEEVECAAPRRADAEPAGDEDEEIDGGQGEKLPKGSSGKRPSVAGGQSVGGFAETEKISVQDEHHRHGDESEQFKIGFAGRLGRRGCHGI